MKRRRRGTLTRISAWIRGHRSEILRVVLWVALLVLAILAVNEPRGWWALRTKIEYLGTAVLLLINGVLLLRAWRTRHRSTIPTHAAASGNLPWEIPLCWPILGIRFPSFLRRIEVTQDGKAYSLNETVLLGGSAQLYCTNVLTPTWAPRRDGIFSRTSDLQGSELESWEKASPWCFGLAPGTACKL